jgi:hypothetical protein
MLSEVPHLWQTVLLHCHKQVCYEVTVSSISQCKVSAYENNIHSSSLIQYTVWPWIPWNFSLSFVFLYAYSAHKFLNVQFLIFVSETIITHGHMASKEMMNYECIILYRVGGTCRVYRLHHSIGYTLLLPTLLVGITIFPYSRFWPPDVLSQSGLYMSSRLKG